MSNRNRQARWAEGKPFEEPFDWQTKLTTAEKETIKRAVRKVVQSVVAREGDPVFRKLLIHEIPNEARAACVLAMIKIRERVAEESLES